MAARGEAASGGTRDQPPSPAGGIRGASAQLKALPWERVPVAHAVSGTGRGRRESRSVKTMAIAANLGGIAFPQARLALRIHRRRQENGKRQTWETVYAVSSLDIRQASPADLAGYVRGHWGIENSSHHVSDVVFAEDASTVHTGSTPRAMAALRNLAIGRLRLLGSDTIAKTTRAIRDAPEHAVWDLGHHRQLAPTGNLKPPCPVPGGPGGGAGPSFFSGA